MHQRSQQRLVAAADFASDDGRTQHLFGVVVLLQDDLNGDGTLDSTNQLASVSLTGQTIDGNAFANDDTMNLFLSGKALREVLDELFG